MEMSLRWFCLSKVNQRQLVIWLVLCGRHYQHTPISGFPLLWVTQKITVLIPLEVRWCHVTSSGQW